MELRGVVASIGSYVVVEVLVAKELSSIQII